MLFHDLANFIYPVFGSDFEFFVIIDLTAKGSKGTYVPEFFANLIRKCVVTQQILTISAEFKLKRTLHALIFSC